MNHSYTPLSPVTFLERSGQAFPQRIALDHMDQKMTFGKLLHRSRCLAQALLRLGIEPGDRVAVLTENCIQSVEAHFGIPGAGAIIVMINPWLSASDIVELLQYSGAKVLIADVVSFQKLDDIWATWRKDVPRVILVNSHENERSDSVSNYEICLAEESGVNPLDFFVKSENDPIAINFTSGTTGKPKGVTYSHRAAYLHALGQVLMIGLNKSSQYLWTLPMFHVNGWGHMWACMAVGCVQIIPAIGLSQKNAAEFIELIRELNVTHLAGAPRLIRLLADIPGDSNLLKGLTIETGGSAPSPALIQKLESIGVSLIHQYGLNETLGPFVVCDELDEWKSLPAEERAKLRARQGIAAVHVGTGLRVLDLNGNDVPHDGRTLGEIAMCGNTVALGYYNNKEATEKAFRGGLFFSGDMAVVHADGFLEIRDRIKDLIYVETEYGWENISSVEIENVLCQNEAVQDAAVIAIPGSEGKQDAPALVAFLELKDSKTISEQEIYDYCYEKLSIYKRPQLFHFVKLPKTATGKVRKDILSKEALAAVL